MESKYFKYKNKYLNLKKTLGNRKSLHAIGGGVSEEEKTFLSNYFYKLDPGKLKKIINILVNEIKKYEEINDINNDINKFDNLINIDSIKENNNINDEDICFFSFINKSKDLYILGLLTEMFIMDNNNKELRINNYTGNSDSDWWSDYSRVNDFYAVHDLRFLRDLRF